MGTRAKSRASRVLSADLQERIAVRLGVHVEAGQNARVVCVMFPTLPLVEALRRYQDEQPLVEAGAHRGEFPPELFPATPTPTTPPTADPEFLAYGKALLAKGHSRLRRSVGA